MSEATLKIKKNVAVALYPKYSSNVDVQLGISARIFLFRSLVLPGAAIVCYLGRLPSANPTRSTVNHMSDSEYIHPMCLERISINPGEADCTSVLCTRL